MNIYNKIRAAAFALILLAATSNTVLDAAATCNKYTGGAEAVTALIRGPLVYMSQKAKLAALQNADQDSKKVLVYGMIADLARLANDALALANTTQKYGTHFGYSASCSETAASTLWLEEDIRSLWLNGKKFFAKEKDQDQIDPADSVLEALENDQEIQDTNPIEEQKLTEFQTKLILYYLPALEGVAATFRCADSNAAAWECYNFRIINHLCSVAISSIRSLSDLIEAKSGSKEKIWARTKMAITALCLILDIVGHWYCNENPAAPHVEHPAPAPHVEHPADIPVTVVAAGPEPVHTPPAAAIVVEPAPAPHVDTPPAVAEVKVETPAPAPHVEHPADAPVTVVAAGPAPAPHVDTPPAVAEVKVETPAPAPHVKHPADAPVTVVAAGPEPVHTPPAAAAIVVEQPNVVTAALDKLLHPFENFEEKAARVKKEAEEKAAKARIKEAEEKAARAKKQAAREEKEAAREEKEAADKAAKAKKEADDKAGVLNHSRSDPRFQHWSVV